MRQQKWSLTEFRNYLLSAVKRKTDGDTLQKIAQLPGYIFIHMPLVPRRWRWAAGGEKARGRSGRWFVDGVALQWQCYAVMLLAASRVLSWGNGCARFRPGGLQCVAILLTRTPAQHKW